MALRYYQKECIQAMRKASEKFSIYQLFCGTGKTNIFTTYLETTDLKVVVMAHPRISLVHQYNMDYYEKRTALRKRYKHYCVSSDHEGMDDLVEFVNSSTGGRLILTTHTSLLSVCGLLIDEGIEIDSVIIDEVHHFGSKKNMDILEDLDVGEILGFTATPANRLQQEKIEYQYGYAEALRDGYCKPFEVDLYVTEDEKTPENLYKGLFYLAEKTKVNNILCFHAFSEVDGKNGKSSVAQYKDLKVGVDFNGTYFTDGVKSHTITGKMRNSERIALLNAVSNAKSKQLNILHSCNTISEGIDTKAIKSICFPDAKGSAKAIIQAIGRITRLDPTSDDPSRVFITFFGVTRDGIAMEIPDDLSEDLNEDLNVDLSEDLGEATGEAIGDLPVAGNTLVNETAYRTILGIIEFLKADNPVLFNAALEHPNILTKEEYEFHFAKVIVNKGGNMYVGKTLDEIQERNVMVCTTDKDGDILSLDDFLDDEKTVTKETGVDDWIYLYVDAETEVVKANLGKGRRTTGTATRKPRKLVVFGDENDAVVVLKVARGNRKKTRLGKIEEFLDWVRENKKLPFPNEENGKFFANLKSIANGTAKGSAPLSPEEITSLSQGLKTKDWSSLTDETFQRHIDEFLNPEIERIDYVVVTRLVKINDLLDWVRENKKLPFPKEEHGNFFAKLKKIANGRPGSNTLFSTEEITSLSQGLKTKEWSSLTDETFQRHIEEFLDPEVEWIDYVVVTRLMKINDLLDWVGENKKLPFPKEEHGAFFTTLKLIANGTAKGSVPLSSEEIISLSQGLKTKEWSSLTDKIFQKKIKEFLDPEVEWIDYTAHVIAAPKPVLAAAVPKTAPITTPKPVVAAPKASPKHHVARYRNTLLSFLEKGNAGGREKLVILQKLKTGARKTGGTLYPEIDEFLCEIDEEWWTATPEELRGAYEELGLEEEFDDTMSIAATVVAPTVALSRATTVAPVRTAPTPVRTAPAPVRTAQTPVRVTPAPPVALSVDSFLSKRLPVVQETRSDAAEIILDYDDAVSAGEELEDHLKEEIWELYKAKHPRLLKHMKNRGITAEQFLAHVA